MTADFLSSPPFFRYTEAGFDPFQSLISWVYFSPNRLVNVTVTLLAFLPGLQRKRCAVGCSSCRTTAMAAGAAQHLCWDADSRWPTPAPRTVCMTAVPATRWRPSCGMPTAKTARLTSPQPSSTTSASRTETAS